MNPDLERKLLEALLRHCPEDVNALNHDGDTPLHIAIANDNYIGIEVFLQYGANVNIRNKKGNTPLHIAIERRDKSTIDLLIEEGANLDLANKEGNSPLHLAAYYCQPDTIFSLIQAGAKLNICNNEENAPLHIVLNFCKTSVTEEHVLRRDELMGINQIISSAEVLIKYAILEDSDLYESWYQVRNFTLLPEIDKLFLDCFSAVRCMKTKLINGRFPFYHLVFCELGNPPILWKAPYAALAINHMLQVPVRRKYMAYVNTIASKFDKSILVFEFLRVATDAKCRGILKIILDEDLFSYFSDYLSNVDILNLTAAFYSHN